ncbi:uncharacterized protein BCR38DRAFT_93282 [Pseudomassariella vexata]|uniref:Thioredoxin-like protein n=1 Tax=Pseudomassariella vexata TaxID=1141098 RepID=A0A1Y2EEW8_9PEZI|nr:uncharacterized protein BCR38DRAFT_93282 [Pseudomassariella vexata]ORY69816.1 hypothetical protein BCR38DRAFT_93282 [Pseudomassariella vexata]
MAQLIDKAALAQEWESFKTPPARDVQPPPKVGDQAPVHPNLPLPADKPTLIVFLRHCGCPFAEKTFKALAKISAKHPEIHCVAISHSSAEATERWVVQVGGTWDVEVVVDHERELYAQWGLGISTTWHVLNPLSLYRTLQLGKQENIWNRTTESGTRWQISGAFALDKDGIVRWAHVAATADDLSKLDEGVAALGVKEGAKH